MRKSNRVRSYTAFGPDQASPVADASPKEKAGEGNSQVEFEM